jgi:hypothetical protein
VALAQLAGLVGAQHDEIIELADDVGRDDDLDAAAGKSRQDPRDAELVVWVEVKSGSSTMRMSRAVKTVRRVRKSGSHKERDPRIRGDLAAAAGSGLGEPRRRETVVGVLGSEDHDLAESSVLRRCLAGGVRAWVRGGARGGRDGGARE